MSVIKLKLTNLLFITIGIFILGVIVIIAVYQYNKTPTSIPADWELVYNWGACHAEKGRRILKINAQGKVVLNSSFVNSEGLNTQQSENTISHKELLNIYKIVVKNDFFALSKQYRDPNFRDGTCSSLNIKADGKEHTVYFENIQVKQIDNIKQEIFKIDFDNFDEMIL